MKHAPNGRGWRFWFAIGTAATTSHGWNCTQHGPQTTRPQTWKLDQIKSQVGWLLGAQSLLQLVLVFMPNRLRRSPAWCTLLMYTTWFVRTV